MMLDAHRQAILATLQAKKKENDPNIPSGPIGADGAFWSWIRDGEYGTFPLSITSVEAGKAITALVRDGFLEIRVRKDELMLKLAECISCGIIKPLKRCFLCSRLLCDECTRDDRLIHIPKDDPTNAIVAEFNSRPFAK